MYVRVQNETVFFIKDDSPRNIYVYVDDNNTYVRDETWNKNDNTARGQHDVLLFDSAVVVQNTCLFVEVYTVIYSRA